MSRTALLDNVFANLASAQHSLTNALAAYVGSPAPSPAPEPKAVPSPAKAKAPKAEKLTRLAARRAEYRAKFGPKWYENPVVIAEKAERKAKWEARKNAAAAKKTPAPEPKAPKAKKAKSGNRAAAAAAVAAAAK